MEWQIRGHRWCDAKEEAGVRLVEEEAGREKASQQRHGKEPALRPRQRENQRMSMRDLEVLSSIDPITTTSTGDSE